MKRNERIYDLLSALSVDIDVNKCGTVMTKLVFFITNYSYDIKMWVLRQYAKRYFKTQMILNPTSFVSIVKMNIAMSWSALDSLGHLRFTTRLRLIYELCLRGMITN